MDYLKQQKEYDDTNPQSIEAYAQKLKDMTFQDVLNADLDSFIEESAAYFENKKFKGGLGELVEKHYFHIEPNNNPRPDFYKAGCELKVSSFKVNKNGSFSAKERLVITMINYMDLINESFYNSHFWLKAKLILLIYYLWEEGKNRLDYSIKHAKLFTPSEEDLEIMEKDFQIIQNKVKEGLAHEISGSDTMYLEACTKAATSKDVRQQPNSDIPAKPRAFAFKNSYMTYVLNKYIIGNEPEDESILDSNIDIPFEDYIENKINNYIGYSVEELCREFDISYEKPPKNLYSILAYRILGIKGNHAAEFQKAGIVVKAIRINSNNTITEHMSFPNFKFTEIIKETWGDAEIRNYLDSTKFFFIVYKYDENDVLHLRGCQFWNIPYNDLEENVKQVWKKTRKVINDGIEITIKNGRECNNFPSPSEDRVCHVRPHGKNKEDTYPLPNGGSFPKQCFWLKNSYIFEQIDDKLKQ